MEAWILKYIFGHWNMNKLDLESSIGKSVVLFLSVSILIFKKPVTEYLNMNNDE